MKALFPANSFFIQCKTIDNLYVLCYYLAVVVIQLHVPESYNERWGYTMPKRTQDGNAHGQAKGFEHLNSVDQDRMRRAAKQNRRKRHASLTTTDLFAGVADDRRDHAQQERQKRFEQHVAWALANCLEQLPPESLKQRAATTWLTIVPHVEPGKGQFARANDAAKAEFGLGQMPKDQRAMALAGFSAARRSLVKAIYG